MSSTAVVRWGGLAAMLAGMLMVIKSTMQLWWPASERMGMYVSGLVLVTAGLLAALGLLGLYARMSSRASWLGKAGATLAAVAALASAANLLTLVLRAGSSAGSAQIIAIAATLVGLLGGLLLLGLAALRTRTLSRRAAALPIAMALLSFPATIMLVHIVADPFVPVSLADELPITVIGLYWLALGYIINQQPLPAQTPGTSRSGEREPMPTTSTSM